MTPRVTVVIPTAGRPRLVTRAVESALSQTLREIEVAVVIDGPDTMTEKALSAIADPRLRTVRRTKGGPGAARNTGVETAAGEWVALLDDDDLWAPGKLERQLAVAERSALAYPIVAGRVAADDGSGRVQVWPRRLPAAGEAMGDYLLVRRSPFWGESLIHTSTILARRSLFQEVRFREDMTCHEDMDWLLRATRVEGAGVVFVPGAEPLATWHVDLGRPRASRIGDWRESLGWARLEHTLISRRAYAGFLLTNIAAHAARQRSAAALWQLPLEAFRHGRPRVRDLALFAGIWLLPEAARKRAADLWHRRRRF
ncbi:MAG TPA: glycosyltransferase family 2 protein [Gemmatimonadota bacterium]|nr:glycosyltransferase family 2 protein [Gemmatimonadota bacterium]